MRALKKQNYDVNDARGLNKYNNLQKGNNLLPRVSKLYNQTHIEFNYLSSFF